MSGSIFAITEVKDREDGLRYLLNFTGISSTAYFLGLVMADFLLYLLPVALLVVFALILNIGQFREHGWLIFFLMACFGLPLV